MKPTEPHPLALISDKELSRWRGISVNTLRKLRRLGGGPPFKHIGRAVLYRLQDFDLWFASLPAGGVTPDQPGPNNPSAP